MFIKSNKKENRSSIEYTLMNMPGMLIIVLLGLFDCILTEVIDADFTFFLINIVFGFVIMLVVSAFNKSKLIIPGLVLEVAVLILVIRDKDEIINALICTGLMIVAYLLMHKKINRFSVLVVVVVSAGICLVNGSDSKGLMVCLIVGAIYSLARAFKKSIDYNYMVVVLMLMLVVLPVNDEPIKWTHVKNAIHKIYEFGNMVVDEIVYAYKEAFDSKESYTGYSDSAGLGGAVSDRNISQLIIKRNKHKDVLYLKGSSYKGLSKKGATDKEAFNVDYNTWFVEFANGLMNSDVTKAEANCFSRFEKGEIRYRYLRTKDIIAPATILRIDSEYRNGLKKKAKKGFFYEINYMVIDYGSPYFQKLIKSDNTTFVYHTYAEVKDYIMDVYHVNINDFMSEESYNEKVNEVKNDDKQDYLGTEMETDDIKKLAAEITVGCSTDYEKAKAVETYLRGLTYNKGIDLTKSKNYIESFLFDTKEGYCVHFASAMVLLLRECGVPARYVSGFLHSSGEEIVMSNDAHAWVEVYIKGIGWMTFEPTSSKKSAADLTWGFEANDDAGGIDWNKYYQERQKSDITIDEEGNIIKDGEVVEENVFDGEVFMKYLLKYVAIILIAVLALLIIYLLGSKIWYCFLSPERKLEEDVKKELKKIEKSVPDATDKEILRSNLTSSYEYLNYVADDAKRARIKKMLDDYYRVRFRGDKLETKVN